MFSLNKHNALIFQLMDQICSDLLQLTKVGKLYSYHKQRPCQLGISIGGGLADRYLHVGS